MYVHVHRQFLSLGTLHRLIPACNEMLGCPSIAYVNVSGKLELGVEISMDALESIGIRTGIRELLAR